MATDYTPPEEAETSDLEVLELRKKVKALELENAKFKALLTEHRILDGVQAVSDAQVICVSGLIALKEMQKQSGGYLDLEQVKVLDVLHRNLLLAQGKPAGEEKKKPKKEDVATLLSIVSGLPKGE
jgi:hypothetical protein